uniref:Fas binding factor 1 n=1 Tax=Nannospalax galili TaxID=1026970 RepID=A0A8C6RZM9_NANGA
STGQGCEAVFSALPLLAEAVVCSIDDVLGDLLGDDTTLPEKPVDPASHARDKAGAPQWLLSKAKAKALTNTFHLYADPMVFLESMKDLDDMDADLFGRVKSHSSSGKGAAKISGKEVPSHPKPVSTLTANEKGDTIPTKKPASSFSSCGLQYQFSFEDFKDPLTGLLSDEEEETPKKPPVVEGKPASNKSPNTTEGQGPSVPLTPGDTPIRKKELFDEGDDIMATLGFEDSPNAERRKMGDQEGPLPARFKLDELLGRGTATKLLTRPATGEHRELKLDQEYQKLEGEEAQRARWGWDKEDSWGDEILTFGAYQPTVASSEGRQSRRQSVSRFLEGASDSKGDPNFKQSPPVASSPVHPKKGGADWLGLKDDDLDLLPPSPIQEAQQEGSAISIPSLPVLASQHSALTVLPSAAEPPTKGARLPAKASQASALRESEEEGEDWLSHILSQKKSPGLAREERARPYKGPNSVGTLGHPSSGSTQVLEQATAGEASRSTTQGIPAARPDVTGSSMSWSQATVVLPVGDPKKGMASASGDLCSTEPVISVPHSQEPTRPSLPVQSLLSESLMQSLLPGSAYQKQLLAAQGQLQSSTAQLQAELLQSQTKLSELEAQVRKLEMERAQHRMLLESLQQRHQADLELIEDAHRSRIKVLETSYQQREEQLRRENEALSAKHVLHCREAEQAQAELIAQHQRHLAAAAQEKDQEVARLRELQQASILEMRKDHEHQLQRLKMLKDQEIDAVTSATSHTRSLNGIIEQMEKFSSSLTALSSRVEASHLTTSQERELGIRQQDEQLRAVLQERPVLDLQERWRVTAEKSKAESAQRTLEEQRKVMVQQISMEREELERAKSALLEEQKSVMHKCGEERRRLAAEWAEYFTQQKLSKERAEREAERALHVDSQREGTLISLTKEQAELTVRACELRAKEEKLAAEREAVERERQELRLEKDRLHKASLRLQARAQEVEHMSKVASKKYQEGEQALQEARQMQCEQQERLQAVQRQQEWLRQQEQHVHQEHLSLAQQRLQLNRVRQDLPSSLLGLPSRVQGPAASSLDAPQALAPSTSQYSRSPAAPIPTQLLAKLLLLKRTAEEDHDFLENEQFFLETLKKAPYNMASHSV